MCNRIVGRVCAFFCVCLFSLDGWGQWRFTSTLSVSGNCSDLEGSVAKAAGRALVDHHNGKTYTTREECERFRAMGSVVSDGACKVRIITTPCKGPGGSSGTNLLGPDKGSSFYSTNAANEIRDWAEDDVEKHLALDKNYSQLNNPWTVMTNDKEFDNVLNIDLNKPFRSLNIDEDGRNTEHSEDLSMNSLRDGFNKVKTAQDFSVLANEANVQQYVDASQGLAVPYLANPQNLAQLLHMEFKNVSGFDVDAIRQRLPSGRTEAEEQALKDYKQYRKEVIEKMAHDIGVIIDKSKEKKEIDGAILAYDVYGTDKDNYLKYTNYQKVPLNDINSNDPIKGLADAIKVCNDTGKDTGIHIELYQNQITGTYVISCAGSDDKEDWLYNNAANVLGGDVPQYIMAKVIADAIERIPVSDRSNLNIEVVGHSLGGGMASIIGLATGIETKTYNAARVPENFLKENGLLDKVKNGDIQNISAYHTSTDILTSTQQLAGTPAIGVSINIGDPSTIAEKSKAMVVGAAVGGVAVPGMGAYLGAKLGEKGEGHRMGPIVRQTYNDRMEQKKAEWDRFRNIQSNLRKEATSIEYQTQETILIHTGNK